MHQLWPINRSITGKGLRKTLRILKQEIPELKIRKIPSGTKVFDWVVPEEWRISEAWIKDDRGRKILDFKNNNLHVVGYSTSIDKTVDLNSLKKENILRSTVTGGNTI